MDSLKQAFFGNSMFDYLVTFMVIIAGIVVVFAIKTYFFSILVKRAKRTKNSFDALLATILGKTLVPCLYYLVVYASLQRLNLHSTFKRTLDVIGIILLTLLSIHFLMAVIAYGLENIWSKGTNEDRRTKNVKSLMPVIRIAIYGIGVFFLLDNLGFKVSALVAGLGITGVAVALAGQTVLADLFSYFSILFDRPFEIGDSIVIDTFTGTVEHIGVKTTRIRSINGEQLVFSNTDLTNSRVRNYKRMDERRVVFNISVVYSTKSETVKEIPVLIRDIIEKSDKVRFDRAHLKELGTFSLNYEIAYYVCHADYNMYMDINQQININIFEEFGKRGIKIAYPSQTLYVNEKEAG